ncbi:MAG: hypothetical protein ACTSYI_02990 [Promethearchaeota archaeon]
MEKPNSFYDLLKNPLTPQKPQILKNLTQCLQNRIVHNLDIYFCSQCGFSHRRGKIYGQHKPFAVPIFRYLPVSPISIERKIICKVVGLYHLQTYSLFSTLPSNLRIRLCLLKNHNIEVYSGSLKLGYIPRNLAPEIERILSNPKYETSAYYMDWTPFKYAYKYEDTDIWKYEYSEYPLDNMEEYDDGFEHIPLCAICGPRKWNLWREKCYYKGSCDYENVELASRFFSTAYARIRILILDWTLFDNITKGLFELHILGYPDVANGLRLFPEKARKSFIQLAKNKKLEDLVQQVETMFPPKKITTSQGDIYL